MKKENLNKVVEIDIELKSILNRVNEISNLEKKLQSYQFESTKSLQVKITQSIITINNAFTCSDLLFICQHRKVELQKQRELLLEKLEEL